MDMGCGTGVLGILAAKLGAAKTEGIDIEEWAVENSIENAGRNGVEMHIELGGAEKLPTEKTYDIFLANINRNILLQDMDSYVTTLKSRATILFSGFLEPDVHALKESCTARGLVFKEEKAEDNWRCLIFNSL
jgi:ribosomal protein L11 methyltransferase